MKRKKIIEISGCMTCPNHIATFKNTYRCMADGDLNPLPEDGSIHDKCPLPSLIDYRTLIKKYFKMLREIEGIDYTDSFNLGATTWGNVKEGEITKEEAIELIKLSNEEI